MADLAAIQAGILPRLERLLALAAGWAEPALPFTGDAGRSPSAAVTPGLAPAAGSPSVMAAGATRADSTGEGAAGNVLSPHGSAPVPHSAAGPDAGADLPDAARPPAPVIPSASGPFRLPAAPAPHGGMEAPRRQPPMSAALPRPAPPPHPPPEAGGTTALPRFRLARRATVPTSRPPALGVAGAGSLPEGARSAPDTSAAGAAPLPGIAAPGLAAPDPVILRPPTRLAPGSLPLPPAAAPLLAPAAATPAPAEDMLEDALADLLERAALEAGVSPP